MLGPYKNYSEEAQICIATELQSYRMFPPHSSHPPIHLTPTHSLITPPHTHPLTHHSLTPTHSSLTHPLTCCEAGSLFLRELYSESIVISSWERGHPPERGTSPWERDIPRPGSLSGRLLSGGSLFGGHVWGSLGSWHYCPPHPALIVCRVHIIVCIPRKNTKAFRICSL